MAQHFDPRNAPFDRLSGEEIDVVRGALDIAYYRPNETIIAPGGAPESLFVVIKGAVEERDGDDLVALRGPGDMFDSRALVQGRSSNAFVAREEALCNLLPRAVTLRLIDANPRFASFFFLDIAHKLDTVSRRGGGALHAAARARVDELFHHPAIYVDATETIAEAGLLMRDHKTYALFVTGAEGVGILTRSDLLNAVLCDHRPLDSAVGPLAHRPVVSVAPDDLVTTALLRTAKSNKRRVAVGEEGQFVGLVEDIDLLSFLAGNWQLVGADRQVARRVRPRTRRAPDRIADLPDAPARGQGRPRLRDRLRPQPAPVPQALRASRTELHPGGRLPRGDGAPWAGARPSP